MAVKESVRSELSKLRTDVLNLKSFLDTEHDNQAKINSEIIGCLDFIKLWKTRLPQIVKILKKLNSKYKEQKIELDVYNRLLGGRMRNCQCQCGRTIDIFSMNPHALETSPMKTEIPSGSGSSVDITTVNKFDAMKTMSSSQLGLLADATLAKNVTLQRSSLSSASQLGLLGDVALGKSTQKSPASLSPRSIGDSCDKRSSFTYSGEFKKWIGATLEDFPNYGPLKRISDNGVFRFEAADWHKDVDKDWKVIANGRDGWVHSKPLMLSDHWNGLILGMRLSDCDEQKFSIRFSAPDIKLNRKVKMPQTLKFRVNVDNVFVSNVSNFKIDELSSRSSFAEIFIPLKNLNKSKLPNIDFEFFHCH